MRRAAALALLLAACAPTPESPPARGLFGDSDGLQPAGTPLRIDFGRAEAGVVAAVTRLVGAGPVAAETGAPCGGPAVTTLRWANGLALNFREGTFVGWISRTGRGAAVRTTGGLAPGTPAAALSGAALRDTGSGPVFEAGGVAGRIEDGEVAALWAGEACTTL